VEKRVMNREKREKEIPVKATESRWYAAYTNPRTEKKVYQRLVDAGIETFLPLQKSKRKWSDRIKWVEEPLIKSYIFVKVKPIEFPIVFRTPGIVRFIAFEGRPVSIPETQINNLRLLVDSDAEIDVTSEKFEKGDNIEVIAGSLAGLRGELIKTGTKKRVVVRIDSLEHNILVTIPHTFLAKLPKE
jgi:transcription antitermination factor NusG